MWISRSDRKSTLDYAAKYDIPLSELVLEPLHSTALAFGLEVVPHLAVVDKNGTVKNVWEGRQSWRDSDIVDR